MERQNQINHILRDGRRHSSVLDIQTFRGADCDTYHYLMVAKVSERLALSTETAHKFHMERLNFRILNEVEGKEQYQVEIPNKVSSFGKLRR
jgi:hypothetical protein